MGKRVLIAVNPDSDAGAALFYGRQLADRTTSSVLLIAVSPNRRPLRSKVEPGSLDTSSTDHVRWVEKLLDECQGREAAIEVFLSRGDFFDEVIRFVQAQPSVQFIVMAVPTRNTGEDGPKFSAGLKRLRQSFAGEILLIRKAGEVTRVADTHP